MRLLNETKPKVRMIYCPQRPASYKHLDLYGTRVLMNSDDLSLYLLDSEEPWPEPPKDSKKPQFYLSSIQDIRFLVLNVTHKCNLACTYCFASKYDDLPIMEPAVAIEAVDRLLSPTRPIVVSFFGGEPLVAWDTIVATVQHCNVLSRARKQKHTYHITTNATLLDEDRIKFIAANGISLLVSLDGPKDIHDESRLMKSGKGSFEEVMRALRLLKDLGWSKETAQFLNGSHRI